MTPDYWFDPMCYKEYADNDDRREYFAQKYTKTTREICLDNVTLLLAVADKLSD